ncbi:MAG TPA: ComEC/Rec2 family competence protein [Armatimonadota bacterium]|nr:ComEC/Rec2 family competence protein [Armatimonadota bacterium]
MLTDKLRAHKERLAIVSLAVIAAVIWWQALSRGERTFSVWFLDVGQGDCIFLRTPSQRTILVDGGGRSDKPYSDLMGMKVVTPILRREAVNRIDVVVLTHPHEDHVQGLVPVLRDFYVGMVLDPGIPHGSESYRRFLSLIEKRRIPYRRATRGQVIDFGDGVRAQVLHPPPVRLSGTRDDANNNSIVLRLTYGKSSVLLTGDADAKAEGDILASGIHVRSDVLKIAHHGSDSAASDQWLDAVRARLAVISVGRSNPFGHPSRRLLDRLSAHRMDIRRTDRDGAVIVRFSPNSFSVRTSMQSPKD